MTEYTMGGKYSSKRGKTRAQGTQFSMENSGKEFIPTRRHNCKNDNSTSMTE